LPGFIEFTGQEAMMWMFVGIFYGAINAPAEKGDLEFDEQEFVDQDLATDDLVTENSAETTEAEEPVVVSKIMH
jgi:hypothetical protein